MTPPFALKALTTLVLFQISQASNAPVQIHHNPTPASSVLDGERAHPNGNSSPASSGRSGTAPNTVDRVLGEDSRKSNDVPHAEENVNSSESGHHQGEGEQFATSRSSGRFFIALNKADSSAANDGYDVLPYSVRFSDPKERLGENKSAAGSKSREGHMRHRKEMLLKLESLLQQTNKTQNSAIASIITANNVTKDLMDDESAYQEEIDEERTKKLVALIHTTVLQAFNRLRKDLMHRGEEVDENLSVSPRTGDWSLALGIGIAVGTIIGVIIGTVLLSVTLFRKHAKYMNQQQEDRAVQEEPTNPVGVTGRLIGF